MENNDRRYDSMCIVTDAAILLFADQDADAQTSRSVHRCAQGEGVHVKGDGRPRSGRWIRVALRMHGVIDIEVFECGRGRLWQWCFYRYTGSSIGITPTSELHL